MTHSNRWEDIQNRLKTVKLSLERDFEPNSEKKAETLRNRAKALAKKTERPDQDEGFLEVVEFFLAHEKYCIELTHIREVYPLREITPLPCTPPYVLGIINFRGQIISIIDLKKFFELPEQEGMNHQRVIILHSDEMEFGILADDILGVRSVPVSEIQPSLTTLTGVRAEYLRGITKDHAVILNGRKILLDKNIIVHQEI